MDVTFIYPLSAFGSSILSLKTVGGEDDISQIGKPSTVFAREPAATVKKDNDGEFSALLPGLGGKILQAGLRFLNDHGIPTIFVPSDIECVQVATVPSRFDVSILAEILHQTPFTVAPGVNWDTGTAA